MAKATNDSDVRPWTPMEVEAATMKMLTELNTGKINLSAVSKMYNNALHFTPDEEKLWFVPKGAGDEIRQELVPNDQLTKAYGTDEYLPLHDAYADGRSAVSKLARMPPMGGYQLGDTNLLRDITTLKDVLDSTISGGVQGGGILARVDILPQLMSWILAATPGLLRFAPVPANGINHVWNNLIDLGDAADGFIDEFGCPVPGKGTYFRGQTNIAILALERGASLKLEFAVRQSGMSYNGMGPYELEMRNAFISRLKLMQKCMYQGTTLQIAGTPPTNYAGLDEHGTTFLNGFNGFRQMLSGYANAAQQDFYPSPYTPLVFEQKATGGVASGTIMDAIDAAAGAIMEQGGQPTAIHLSVRAARKLRGEATPFIRYMMSEATGGGFVLGGHVRAVDTVAGELPLVVIPGNHIGAYTPPSTQIGGVAASQYTVPCEDLYVLTEPEIVRPYLGSPDPMPIELPLGLPDATGHGCLLRKFILYWMMGLAIYVPVHQAKVRIPV